MVKERRELEGRIGYRWEGDSYQGAGNICRL